MYLETINSPEDVKKIEIENLPTLAEEMRKALIHRLSKLGGHEGPNLGVVELSIALHYVFQSPKDKIVFDISHQCYCHKMLTGRKDAYLYEKDFDKVTGYTNIEESEHDLFTIGHTSTSISLALGLAKGRDVSQRQENVIAVIGDGSLSGGEALEALNYAGEYQGNLIIVVNDNDQSIAENHGGLYRTLKSLRENQGVCEHNLFQSFGLEYRYLEDGHDIAQLIELFQSVKDIDHPVVLHIHTIKGKGLPYAEKNREAWHFHEPFRPEDGSSLFPMSEDTTVFDSLIELLKSNQKAVIVNAATPASLGFVKGEIRTKYAGEGRFIDVGIAEENAIAMISGIARSGGTPVFGTYAPFLQRTYDQVSHDLCLNHNPATILVLMPGVYGMNSNTHIALCDIQFFAHIPNLVYLEPVSKEEYRQMFRFATTQRGCPVAIRVPAILAEDGVPDNTDYSLTNRAKVVKEGTETAIITLGSLLPMAVKVAEQYEKNTGRAITVIHPRFLSGIDVDLLDKLKEKHHLIITMEDGEVDGGYGQRISSYYGTSTMKVINLGLSKAYHSDFIPEELLAQHGMSVEKLVNLLQDKETSFT